MIFKGSSFDCFQRSYSFRSEDRSKEIHIQFARFLTSSLKGVDFIPNNSKPQYVT